MSLSSDVSFQCSLFPVLFLDCSSFSFDYSILEALPLKDTLIHLDYTLGHPLNYTLDYTLNTTEFL